MRQSTPKPSHHLPGLSERNIEAIVHLEQRFQSERSVLDRISDGISNFVGSIRFVIAHALLIAAWVLINFGPQVWRFDPYPFVFLNLVLAVETVFLSTFVLMSQNRQTRQADRWAHLDLQLSMLAEQETTKMLQMLQKICDQVGLPGVAADKELKEMVKTTQVEVLSGELDQAREVQEQGQPPQPPAGETPVASKSGNGTSNPVSTSSEPQGSVQV